MKRTLLSLVHELNSLNDENLAERVILNNDVQWCLGELQDILDVIGDMPISRLRELAEADREGVTPCTFCRFNPPSSCDGKPCCVCPADKK